MAGHKMYCCSGGTIFLNQVPAKAHGPVDNVTGYSFVGLEFKPRWSGVENRNRKRNRRIMDSRKYPYSLRSMRSYRRFGCADPVMG